jgi:soluble lytic murein transglycosylase
MDTVYHAGLAVTSIDIASFLNYKEHMILKRLLPGLCLVSLLYGCASGSAPLTTPSPSQTLSVGVLPLDTSMPSFTPSPTPTAEVRVKSGDEALFNGDFDKAYYEYQNALASSTNPDVLSAALWGLGRDEVARADYSHALQALRQLTSRYPSSSNAIRAYFLMGNIYMALARYAEAAQAYTVYLALRPGVIDAYAQEVRGDAFASSGNDVEAIAAYQAALTTSGDNNSEVKVKIAQAYVDLGDTSKALEIYDSILKNSSNDYEKARMDLFSGQIYLSLGQSDLAYQFYLDAVNNYPVSYDSYSALVALVNDGVPVDEMNRGLTDYFAGQYGYALAAFQRYIAANPENDGTPHYYSALALSNMGNSQEALDEYSLFIMNYPDNRYWQSAWDEKASLQSGSPFYEYEAAAQTLLAFIQQAPGDANAPSYLMEAARNLERAGKLEDAAQICDRMADEYPGSEYVPQALFWAGIARYRHRDYSDALVTFQRDLILSINSEDQARALFWIGKTQQILSDTASAQTTWQQAAMTDPTDYYSLRAQDKLFNRPAFETSPATNLAVDLTGERASAEAWLRLTFKLPLDTSLGMTGALQNDPHLIRGTEFWKLGLESQAQDEFFALQAQVDQDPADSFRLGNYLLELGLYYPAIFSFRQVLTLAGMNSQSQTLAAPAYFNHIRYGLYFQDLVLPDAQNSGFDPLFIFSLMRQESIFNKLAGSSQGARGLMQITPDTGQFIVDNLGWPLNYKTEDLYRPVVNIQLGTNHLMKLLARFDGEFYTALAAYNAGENAAPIWRNLSGSDPDLFVEVVRYEETRNYIRGIYENFKMYQTLYNSSQ